MTIAPQFAFELRDALVERAGRWSGAVHGGLFPARERIGKNSEALGHRDRGMSIKDHLHGFGLELLRVTVPRL